MKDVPVAPEASRSSSRPWPAILFFLALFVALFWFTRSKNPTHLDIASLQLTTPAGTPLPPTAYRGKAVVLNFWAPWCGPCNLEAPWLQAVQTKFSPDLVVLGIDHDADTYSQIPEFASRTGVTYPLLAHNARVRDAVGQVTALPTTLYIDRSGKVVHTVAGAIPQALMEQYAAEITRR